MMSFCCNNRHSEQVPTCLVLLPKFTCNENNSWELLIDLVANRSVGKYTRAMAIVEGVSPTTILTDDTTRINWCMLTWVLPN